MEIKLKMPAKMVKRCADIIQSEVGYFNGWSVSEESERNACEQAAMKIAQYIMRKINKELNQ